MDLPNASPTSRPLSVNRLCVSRGHSRILSDLSFDIPRAEPFAIVGPSGSGKTTLLMATLGLTPIESGQIQICGHNLLKLNLRERSHLVGLVFQDYQLFPHLTVLENIELALKAQGLTTAMLKVPALLEEMGIKELSHRGVHEISGGQKQRVAIARALVLNPRILFFDEPSSALDPKTTEDLARLFVRINERTQIVIVSHDRAFVEATCKQGLRLQSNKASFAGNACELFD